MSKSARLFQCFDRIRTEGRGALFPYVMAGDPDLGFTRKLLPALVEAGADGFEVGIPFSDPLADGPTIQQAGMRSLASGTTLRKVLDLVGELRAEIPETPIVLMTYYNCIIAFGLAHFAREAASCGTDAVIVPDLPPEESGELGGVLEDFPVETIFMLAPTSTDERIALVNNAGGGFLYYVGQMGVTGARASLDPSFVEVLERINRIKNRPVLMGFGIKTPEHAAAAANLTEGVIVGSALIDVMDAEVEQKNKIDAACRYMGVLREALSQPKATS